MADLVIEFDVPENMKKELLYFVAEAVTKFKEFDDILEEEVDSVRVRFSGMPDDYIKWHTEDKKKTFDETITDLTEIMKNI